MSDVSDNLIRAGVVQFDVKKGDIPKNLEVITGHLEHLAKEGCSLAVLPEMFSCSFDNECLHGHAAASQMVIDRLAGVAADQKMAIAGSLPVEKNGCIYNTMIFIDRDGRVKGYYEKMHLFRLTGEHLYYKAGNRPAVLDTSLGCIGLMTCYDLRFPELARMLTLKGAQMILVSAQWPSPRRAQWASLITARSIENQLFMVCANRTGTEDDLEFPGMSMITGPLGEILIQAGEKEGALSALMDFKAVDDARNLIPCMSDRREDIYG